MKYSSCLLFWSFFFSILCCHYRCCCVFIFASSLFSHPGKADKGREYNPLKTLCHRFFCLQGDQQWKLSLNTPVKCKENWRRCHFYSDKRQKQSKRIWILHKWIDRHDKTQKKKNRFIQVILERQQWEGVV